MIIKINENKEPIITEAADKQTKEIYYACYSETADMTFIIKHTLKADGPNRWIDHSEECVGWHHGEPNGELDSIDEVGNNVKYYGSHADDELVNNFIADLTTNNTLLKVEDK